MRYEVKTTTAGPVKEILIYPHVERKDSPEARAKKEALSNAAKHAQNRRASSRAAYLLAVANFFPWDYHATLTCDNDHQFMNRGETLEGMRKFVRVLRKQRRRRGKDLRYIYVIECLHGLGRYHVHVFINSTGDRARDEEEIRSLWEYGSIVHVETIGSRGFKELAEYVTKERPPVGARSFIASQNLKRPVEERRVIDKLDMGLLDAPEGYIELERKSETNLWGSFFFVRHERRYRWLEEEDKRPGLYAGADKIISRTAL